MSGTRSRIQDAFTSMLRTDYISLRDTERLNLLSKYYVDYFGYLSQIVGEQDQLIVGRRGTGKTTLLYRGLIECMNSWSKQNLAKPRTLGIYIDLGKLQVLAGGGDSFQEFERFIVSEICEALAAELQRSWPQLSNDSSLFKRIFQNAEAKKVRRVREELEKLAAVITSGRPRFLDRSGKVAVKEAAKSSKKKGSNLEISGKPSKAKVSFEDRIESASEYEEASGYSVSYSLTVGDVLQIINELRNAAQIPAVLLFIDEFSALSDELQGRFTTLLKAILGNHAGLFVKLCAITDHYSLGSSIILQRDLFVVSLDFDAFVDRSGSLGAAMGELESLTRKIVTERLRAFASVKTLDVFEDPRSMWIELSRESMGVPRTIGIVLQQAWQRATSAGKEKIRRADIEYGIQYASKAYLNQMLGASRNGVAIPSYVEEIWDALVSRAIAERPKGHASTSHFMVLPKNENKLRWLNMFFVIHLLTGGRTTKKDKASRSLYVFDYGVCLENHLGFGDDKNVLRQQRFAYDDSLTEFDRYFDKSSETRFICPECKNVYSDGDLLVAGHRLQFCPKDRTDLQVLESHGSGWRYTEEEIKIIGSIRASTVDDELTARQVADDVGCYVQKVSKFGEKLDRAKIIDRQRSEEVGKHIYYRRDV